MHTCAMEHTLCPINGEQPYPTIHAKGNGVTMNDVPKIHKEDPTVDDHVITFMETGFKIPLSHWGIFSYFPTSKPTHDDLLNPTEVYILSPATWNPHSEAYSANEESILDWEGNTQQRKNHQHQIVFDDIEDDLNMVASLEITQLDTHLVENEEHYEGVTMTTIPKVADNVSSTLRSISKALVDHDLSWHMCEREQDGHFAASIGSTNTLMSQYISDSESDEDDSSYVDDDMMLDLDSEGFQEQVEEFLSHATNASRPHGVTPEHLSKVWCISTEDARRTIETTTQTSVRTQDPTLSRNYGTNDRMLRYRHIQDYFFMDTFFATKKRG